MQVKNGRAAVIDVYIPHVYSDKNEITYVKETVK